MIFGAYNTSESWPFKTENNLQTVLKELPNNFKNVKILPQNTPTHQPATHQIKFTVRRGIKIIKINQDEESSQTKGTHTVNVKHRFFYYRISIFITKFEKYGNLSKLPYSNMLLCPFFAAYKNLLNEELEENEKYSSMIPMLHQPGT